MHIYLYVRVVFSGSQNNKYMDKHAWDYHGNQFFFNKTKQKNRIFLKKLRYEQRKVNYFLERRRRRRESEREREILEAPSKKTNINTRKNSLREL